MDIESTYKEKGRLIRVTAEREEYIQLRKQKRMKITYIPVDTVSELYENLRTQEDYCGIMLGSDYEKQVTSGEVIISDAGRTTRLGLIKSGVIKPMFLEWGGLLYIGFNEEVVVFKENRILNRYKSNSAFYEFLHCESNCLIAMFEIDVFCFNTSGELKWEQYLSDINVGSYIHGDELIISLFEGDDDVRISISTGEVIAH